MSYDVDFRELADLTSECAIEVDRYVQGLDYNSKPLDRFRQVLSDLQLKDTDNFMTVNDTGFYLALYEAAKKDSNKELKRFSDLALEMRLLRIELDCATETREKGELARSILVNLSKEFSSRVEPFKHYVA